MDEKKKKKDEEREIDYILFFHSLVDERISYRDRRNIERERRKAWTSRKRERERQGKSGNTLTELTKRYLKRKSSWDFLETRPGTRSGNETGCGEEMCV